MEQLFTLEAVFARKGDALILHFGPADDPAWILIDGGPAGVYKGHLRPRLMKLREDRGYPIDEPFPFEMVMVSHIDADHVVGVLDMFKELERADEQRQPKLFRIRTLWHNSFDDLLGNKNEEVLSRLVDTADDEAADDLPLPESIAPEAKAVVASTRQGRDLRNAAKRLRVKFNRGFDGLVMTNPKYVASVRQKHDMVFTIIGPRRSEVAKYQQQWDKDLEEILAKEAAAAGAASFSDKSPFNLASISVLAERMGKSMLLTGDARGDFVMDELASCGRLPLHVDLLKVPHHGSDRNVEPVFFEQVTADHYVISGDGEHGNPELATLEMLTAARGADPYTVHFTFTEDAHEHEENEKRKKALAAVNEWARTNRPPNCTVVFRENEAFSVTVPLL